MTVKVSVCMPTFNSANYLPEAIESVLRQSYTDFEFLISDDCSSDETVAIARRYAEIDKRIVLRINKQNEGQARNLNLCLKYAKGDYIKFVFSDDLLVSEDALEKMVAVLDNNDEIALVASARYVIDSRSNIIDLWSEYRGKIGFRGSQIIQDCLVEQNNRIGEPTVVLFRRKYSGRGFDVRYKQAVDLEMWFHLLEQGNFAYINEPLCAFRIHGQQETSKNLLSIKFILVEESFLMLRTYADKPYIKLNRILRAYMRYVPLYSIWKLYKNERISRQDAIEKIRERYGYRKFVSYYPLFKLYKLLIRTSNQFRMIAVKAFVPYKWKYQVAVQAPISVAGGIRSNSPYNEYWRAEIDCLLPDASRNVLEIGVGAGNTLLWRHKDEKQHSWMGETKIARDAAPIPHKNLDALYNVNTAFSDLPIKESSLDLVLCFDVLDHIADPWTAVRCIHKLLKPGGALIVSVPNVRNKEVLFPLLFKGQWNYTNAGILDRRHLRLFVRDTAIALVSSSGLKVDMVMSTGLGRGWRSRVANIMTPSLLKSLFEKKYLIRGIRIDS